jgi:hypothetical protein
MDAIDDAKLQAILAGTALHLPGEGADDARIVRAEWIIEAVRLGIAVDIDNAIVAGPLDLEGRYIPAPFSIAHSRLAGISLRETRFLQPARFDGSSFEGRAELQGLRAESDVSFAQARFNSDIDLTGVAVGGALTLTGVTIAGSMTGTGARLVGSMLATELSVRGGMALDELQVGADLMLDGACVDGAARFRELSVIRHLSAKNATFKGDLSFERAQVGGQLDMSEATWRADVVQYLVPRSRLAQRSAGRAPARVPADQFRTRRDVHRIRRRRRR